LAIEKQSRNKTSMARKTQVGWLSFFFVLKLLLDMSALAVVNIPMYGVLKSSTTPCVLVLDYCLRGKTASKRVVGAVAVITVGACAGLPALRCR
jgi:solute carrier family 35 protein